MEAGWIYAVPVAYWTSLPESLILLFYMGPLFPLCPFSCFDISFAATVSIVMWVVSSQRMTNVPPPTCQLLAIDLLRDGITDVAHSVKNTTKYYLHINVIWKCSVLFLNLIYTKLLLFSETRLQTATSFSVKPLDKHSPFAMAYFSSF